MNQLSSELKYYILQYVFQKETVEYLKNNEYLLNGIIKSNKKEFNLMDLKSGESILYKLINNDYNEKLILDLLGNKEIIYTHEKNKFSNKIFGKLWKKNYDMLLKKILTSQFGIKYKPFIIKVINSSNYTHYRKNFRESLPELYKIVPIDANNINDYNKLFYLDITKKYYNNNYEKVLRSSFIYEQVKYFILAIGFDLTIKFDTMIAKEILESIHLDILNKFDSYENFLEEVLEIGLIKTYDDICYNRISSDSLPISINTILATYNLTIDYGNIDDFKIKIKPICSDLIKLIKINNSIKKYLSIAIEEQNEELAITIFKKFINNKESYLKKNDDCFNVDYLDKKLINDLIDSNMNKLLLELILNLKIRLYLTHYGYDDKAKTLSNSFLDFIISKKKVPLVKSIIDNKQINDKYGKKKIINYVLSASIVHSCRELIYDILDNYHHLIDFRIINTTIYEDGKPILFWLATNNLDDIFDLLLKKLTKIDLMVSDSTSCSFISWLIINNKHKYLEPVINSIEKDIFLHIMSYVPNKYTSNYNYKFSDGKELYWACKKNLNNIAWFFVSNKLCNIKFTDSDGNDCLILACMNKMETVAGTLAQTNLINLNHKNNQNKTAYDYAKENKMFKVCELIEKSQKKMKEFDSNLNSKLNKSNLSEKNNNPFETNPFTSQNIDKNQIQDILNWINLTGKK
jgi:hypothetical protein